MPKASSTRWLQLVLGLIVMMTISSPQYVWTLFVKPFQTTTSGTLPAVQITFSLLIVLQTWLSPAQGYLVERFGPRTLVAVGAALSGLGWIVSSQITSLFGLYLTYGVLCGIGTGIVYIGIVGLMARWFPDRRGFAIGMVAAGYGMGALLTTFPIDSMIRSSGYQSTLVTFGIVFAIVGVAAALGLRAPQAGEVTARPAQVLVGGRDTEPWAMLKTPIFWLMFAMMTMMSTTGLMVTSQMGAFTRDFGMASALVFGLPVLPLALSVDRVTNGLTRPLFGWISDRLGRENTMLVAFGLEGCAMTMWLLTRHNPTLFVVLSGVVFFGWGEIFSLFPSTLTDTFGTKHATANYGCLYIAQGVGSVFGGPVAALLHEATGSWIPVFATIIAMDFATAALAIGVLKPMRRRWLEQSQRDAVEMSAQEGEWAALRTNS